MVSWNFLADLRRRGTRPELPVYITDRRILAANMHGCGCVAILHQAGEPMPVRWLHGLDVMLAFSRCETAGKVKRLMDAREVRPRSLRAWCRCAGGFVACAGSCDAGDEPWAG